MTNVTMTGKGVSGFLHNAPFSHKIESTSVYLFTSLLNHWYLFCLKIVYVSMIVDYMCIVFKSLDGSRLQWIKLSRLHIGCFVNDKCVVQDA